MTTPNEQLNYFGLPMHPMDNFINYRTTLTEYISWVEAYDKINMGEFTKHDLDLILDAAYDSGVFDSTYDG